MLTIDKEQVSAIQRKLAAMPVLSKGKGTKASACSIAAINLALCGRLTDQIPDCMSGAIGSWIIRVQDAMPSELRNSVRWRALLPFAAGTGRAHELERSALITDWMWETVLPSVQDFADNHGFGPEWKAMYKERTGNAAAKAEKAARMHPPRVLQEPWMAKAKAASQAAMSVDNLTLFVHVPAPFFVAASAANVAAKVAYAAANADAAWQAFDPRGLLERLIAVRVTPEDEQILSTLA